MAKRGEGVGGEIFAKLTLNIFASPLPLTSTYNPAPPSLLIFGKAIKLTFTLFCVEQLVRPILFAFFLFLHSFSSSFDICLSFYALHPAVSLFSPLSQTSNNFGTTLAAIVTPLRSLHLDAIRVSFL